MPILKGATKKLIAAGHADLQVHNGLWGYYVGHRSYRHQANTPVRDNAQAAVHDVLVRGILPVDLDAKEKAEREATIGRYMNEGRFTKPTTQTKHLFGIDHRRHGFFVVDNEGLILDRTTWREINAEAKAEGLEMPYFIFCRIATYTGLGMEVMRMEGDKCYSDI